MTDPRIESFASTEDAQRFIVQTTYDHFHRTGEWPRARDLDLDYGDVLNPFGGLELLCRQLGSERIWCGSPAGEHDRVTLNLREVPECKGGTEDIQNFLAAVRFAANRYHERRGKEAMVSVQDLTTAYGLSEIEARRALELLSLGDSLVQGGGAGTWTLAHTVSRFRDVRSFDEYLTRVEDEVRRRQAISHLSLPRRRPEQRPLKRLFLSHAADDGSLALHIRNVLLQAAPELHIFVASRAGDIPTGKDWLDAIEGELKKADAYLLLLTPSSVGRPWLWYESGAAWMAERPFIPITAAGLAKGNVPYPLGARQVLALDNPADVEQLARDLGVTIPDPDRFCETVQDLSRALPKSALSEFEGVVVGDRFFAWSGPVHKLQDLPPIPESEVLIAALLAAGVTPSFALTSWLRWSLAKGLVPVYETDKRTWKREVIYSQDGDQQLLVSPPQKAGM